MTAAHNFNKRDDDGENLIEFVDAVFSLQRKGEKNMLAKFDVKEYVTYNKFRSDDEEYFL